jgi:general secretion pathway protein E
MGMSLAFICDCLCNQGLLSEKDRARIQEEAPQREAKLEREKTLKKAPNQKEGFPNGVTPLDVIASMHLPAAGNQAERLTEEKILQAVAAHTGISYKKIDPLELDLEIVTKTIPRSFALKNLLVPLAIVDETLHLIVHDPTNTEVIDDLKRALNINIQIYVSPQREIIKVLREFFGFRSTIKAAESQLRQPEIDLGNLEQYERIKSPAEIPSTDEHIRNAVNYLFNYALDQRASDIHIEPKRQNSLIRLRIDGVLHPVHRLPKKIHSALVSRIKTLARLNIAEKRRPQDGRIKIDRDGEEAEVRISTVPVAFGEKMVMRILEPEVLFQDLDPLGFTTSDLIKFHSLIKEPNGIILITGPTGSGKTTTLYSTLRYLTTSDKNITTIEDPIEMIYEGFNQIAIQKAIGLTYSNILRNILRQDPDIIMVGEIRDSETAEQAIQAALTGHLVLSTLHTNDSVSAITRLIDLGMQPFLITSSLIGVVAQRLVRKICKHCCETYTVAHHALQPIGIYEKVGKELVLKRGRGCNQCRGTGYWGRSGVFEILPITESMRGLIAQQAELDTIREKAREEGLVTLRENAVQKMLEGISTYKEILRVT